MKILWETVLKQFSVAILMSLFKILLSMRNVDETSQLLFLFNFYVKQWILVVVRKIINKKFLIQNFNLWTKFFFSVWKMAFHINL